MKKILITTAILLTLVLGVLTISKAQSEWEWIETGFDYILYDMSFPEGQSEIGFAVGSTSTYNGDGLIIKTTDSGDTWEQISADDLPGLEACFFINLDTGYVGGWDGYFAKTTDGGDTWTEIEVDSDIWYIIDMEFWDENNGIVAAWGALAFVTDDGGETWTEASGIGSIHDLAYATSEVLYSVGGDENICKSEDGGLTWSEIYSGTFQYVFVGVEFLNEDFGVVGGEDGRILMTDDGGDTWTTNNTTFYHLWHGFHIFNEDSIYVAGTPEAVYKTTDGGVNYVDDYPDSNGDVAFYKILFTANDNTGYVCGSQGSFMRKETPNPVASASVSPEQVNFGQVFLGETAEEIITVSNTGNAVLTVTGISSDVAEFTPDVTSFDVAPGGFEEVTITFEPAEEGVVTGILSIESNDPVNEVIEVDLEGEGFVELLPIGSVDTEEIVYPQTWVGETVEYIVTVTNDGNGALNITNIESDNSVFYPDVTIFEVGPGENDQFAVIFEPDDEAYFEGLLTIETNDPVNPVFEISLQGEGLLPEAIISVASEIVFDTTIIENTSSEMLEIWNIGNATLDITDINVSDDAFNVDLTNMTIEPGESEVISVDFTPDEQGEFLGSLEIVSNDGSSPAMVNLSGYGALGTGIFNRNTTEEALTAYPNPFDDQVVVRIQSAQQGTQTLRIYNMFGALVKEIESRGSNSGTTEFVWNGTGLNGENSLPGFYFGVLKSGDSEKSIKIVKR